MPAPKGHAAHWRQGWVLFTLCCTVAAAYCGEAKEDEQTLEALSESPAFRANLDWHRAGEAKELRTSWFLRGQPNIAMLCAADLSKYEVMTVREVHNWAHQSHKTRKLSHAQVMTLTKLCKALPQSIRPKQVNHIVIVSVGAGKDRKLHVYDRRALPAQIVRLYDLTGAYIATEAEELGAVEPPIDVRALGTGIQVSLCPPDEVASGLFAIGPYKSSDPPSPKQLYQQYKTGLIKSGRNELIGRLHEKLRKRDRFECLSFTRFGHKIVARMAYFDEKGGSDKSGYLRAILPNDLPPGRYDVEISFVRCERVYQEIRELAGKPLAPMTCQFAVPEPGNP
jgi:hypothetical protein